MLTVRGWLALLTKWRRLPLQGAFAELDRQIIKLRLLKDAYACDIATSFRDGGSYRTECTEEST